jgi:hypothetical protein
MVEEAELTGDLARDPDFFKSYDRDRGRLVEEFGKHTRAKMYTETTGREIARDISSGKITKDEAYDLIKGLRKISKATKRKPSEKNDAGVDRTRRVRPLHGYLGGDKEAHRLLKAGPAESIEWLNAVLGSKTKKVYMKKMISGPVGYLPVLAALMNEVKMGQEKKKKKNG